MKTTNYRGIIGFTVLYAVTSFACAFTGFIHPWCWIVAFPALAALLGAYSYCEVAATAVAAYLGVRIRLRLV